MFIALPNAVLRTIQKLNDAGFEAYVVGGCVRDSLLGKTPVDWDITTSAVPTELQDVFSDCRTIETGLKHGTLTVLVDEMPLEITTFRIDGSYTDGRHPDSVSFTRSLAEDLRRRDFTINAMAYHPFIGVVDLYGGQADLSAGIIRCVGEAQLRFEEDALRILRALRFAATLGFAVDVDTEYALRLLSPTLLRVASERLLVELSKLLCGCNAARIVKDYWDVLSVILPHVPMSIDVSNIDAVPNKAHVRFAALFYCAGMSAAVAESAMKHLRADTLTIRYIKSLIDCKEWPIATDADLLRLLNRLGEEWIFDYLALRGADASIIDQVQQLLDDGVCYKVSMLAVNGNDIIQCGIPAGPAVGQCLQMILDAVIDGKCSNTKEAILKYIVK